MLEIGAKPGNYSWGGPGLTVAEARSHFTLWAILKSPLLLGADASLMSHDILAILKNQDLRAIQEDKLGNQAKQLDRAYPGAHANTQTPAVLRPCNASDPQQLWGSSYSNPVVRVRHVSSAQLHTDSHKTGHSLAADWHCNSICLLRRTCLSSVRHRTRSRGSGTAARPPTVFPPRRVSPTPAAHHCSSGSVTTGTTIRVQFNHRPLQARSGDRTRLARVRTSMS
jgi:hypothetical protein